MRFMNPKTGLAFKKIFGSDTRRDILIDFLDSLLFGNRGAIAGFEIIGPQDPRYRVMPSPRRAASARSPDLEK